MSLTYSLNLPQAQVLPIRQTPPPICRFSRTCHISPLMSPFVFSFFQLPAAAALNASAATAAGALKGGLSTAASAGEGAAEADAQRARGGSDPTGGGDAVAVTREASQAWNELLRPPRAAPAAAASAGAEGAAAAKAAAEAQTANQTRVMNIVWFFVVYAGVKSLTENS